MTAETLERQLGEYLAHPGYRVAFRRAVSHDFIYCRVTYYGVLIWERAFFFKWRRYQRAAKKARRAIHDHERALANLGGLL